jgi:hypothetical protein
MIASGRFKQSARNAFQAKLIYTATLAANCYEIGRAESPVEMSRMVERLSEWARRSEVVHVTRAIVGETPSATALNAITWANANRRAF